VIDACRELRQRLSAEAARMLECPAEAIDYGKGRFWQRNAPRRALPLEAVVAQAGNHSPITITTKIDVPRKASSTSYVAQVAEVEVDPETGKARLHRFVTSHDVATIINPIGHQGQIDGGSIMAIGAGLMEELSLEDGKVAASNLGEYKLPNVADIPEFKTVLVRSPNGPGPYQAKGIGEMANVSPPAAIANAVADACGVRLFDLPVTSEKVYKALRGGTG
jgi:nicotinate dehydrogenase medium molybdopterin subunit